MLLNKSMLLGVAVGVGLAAAGGVTAYQLLGERSAEPAEAAPVGDDAQGAHAMHAAPAAAVAPASGGAAAEPAAAAAAVPAEECREEVVAREPRDKHRIAGTAIGALVGGAVANDVGDRDLTTAVGAAVGAFAGNKIQQKIQERNAETVTEVRCAPAQ